MSAEPRPSGSRSDSGPAVPDRWAELAPLVDAVLDAPAERRSSILMELSATDPALRAEVERLVAECERGMPMLDRRVGDAFSQLLVDDVDLAIPEILGGRYQIEHEIGRGGMALVYVARDLKHARAVAVKVIRPDLAASLGRTRFLREIEIAASLRHPNIVPLYDSGDADGMLYFVMPFEEGPSLRTRLDQGGPLPVSQCLNVLRDIARALAYAHEHGVVHRDVKPDNVMMSGGAAVVTDFGIAKAVHAAQSDAPTGTLTKPGAGIGTPAYMAPEQAVGDPATDHRADIYSFGCLAYELFAGHPPFHDLPTHEIIAAHVGTKPVPLSSESAAVPESIAGLVARCLEKSPAARPQSAQELLAELDAAQTGPTELVRGQRRPRRGLLVSAAIIAVGLIGSMFGVRRSRAAWVRETAIPKLQQLADLPPLLRIADTKGFEEGYRVAQRALSIEPNDSVLRKLAARVEQRINLTSEPAGARVYRQAYAGPDSTWTSLGETPLDSVSIPLGWSRLKLEKQGYWPAIRVFGVGQGLNPTIVRLLPLNADTTGELLPVRGGMVTPFRYTTGFLNAPARKVTDFQIGRFEVTNREYKRFVEAGGYRRRELWDRDIRRHGNPISWEQAMVALTDRTGRPGPATWEVSDYPAGQADFPVGGVSWYEAKAYARFVGKQLPTIYHWVWAATIDRAHLIIPQSNFEPRGPAPVGQFPGMTGFGALDMAGNVREWCENATGGDRFALGGAWGEPQHMFNANHHQDPFDRSAANGFRLARFSTSDSAAAGPVEVQVRDFSVERPASDEAFAIYRRAYDYDPTPLDARIEHTDTTAEWIRQRVSFSAGYGAERMIAVIFLPRGGRPPYQTLVSFPGAYALKGTITRDGYTDFFASYVTKSGRAFMLPMYKGTYERSDTMSKTAPNESSYYRDRIIQMGKDLRRSVDYLSTRRDIDSSRIAYFGISWGGAIGGILIAIEPRFRTAVMVSGGLFFERSQPEVDPLNFLPRVRMPVLMINGRYDSIFPVEASQDPMFRMLGTPRDRKQHDIEESQHAPPAEVLFTKAFSWLDRYLGPTQ